MPNTPAIELTDANRAILNAIADNLTNSHGVDFKVQTALAIDGPALYRDLVWIHYDLPYQRREIGREITPTGVKIKYGWV